MLSRIVFRMGGRLVAFYADDLAELMLEDFLKETASELQRIETLSSEFFAGIKEVN